MIERFQDRLSYRANVEPQREQLEYEPNLQRDDPAPSNEFVRMGLNLLVTWLLFVGFVSAVVLLFLWGSAVGWAVFLAVVTILLVFPWGPQG